MKFCIFNEGTCTRLRLFGEDIRKLLLNNFWEESLFEDSDYILINSCSFLKSKEDYFVKIISGKNQLKNSNQKILVFGCLPATNPQRIRNIDNSIIFFCRDIEEIKSFFNLKNRAISPSSITDNKLSFSQKLIWQFNNYFLRDINVDYRLMKKNVYHLKISEGCLGRCSYCSEKLTTKFRSRKIKEIVESFKEGLSLGFKIFALNSDDCSSFGKDNRETIYSLIENLLKIEGEFKIAITEFNPQGLLNSKIFKLMASDKIGYITVPIQSGSQRILNRMRRCYQIHSIISRIKKIRKINPYLKINTHLIAGFPGETEEDFRKTLNLVKEGIFDRIKVFKYSDRLGTESSQFDNKVPDNVKIEREKILYRSILLDSIRKRSLANLFLNLGKI